MVIVNGKDLCGEEEVEGLDDFGDKQKLMSVLNMLHVTERAVKSLPFCRRSSTNGEEIMQRHDELIGDDDEYDELYGDLNIGMGFLQPQPFEAPGPDGALNVGYGQTPETVVPESTPVIMVLKELNVPGGLTEEIKTSQKAIARDASHDSQALRVSWLNTCGSEWCKQALRGEHLLLHILQGRWLILIDLNLKTSHHKEHSI
ncbi:hypothetical protein ACET3Z_004838 [Daucus carota]